MGRPTRIFTICLQYVLLNLKNTYYTPKIENGIALWIREQKSIWLKCMVGLNVCLALMSFWLKCLLGLNVF